MSSDEIQSIYRRLVLYMQGHGGDPYDWYVDVAEDVDQRLFQDHKVPNNSPHADDLCSTDAVAREIEQLLLDYGCDGDRADGSPSGKSVYVYLKVSGTTNP